MGYFSDILEISRKQLYGKLFKIKGMWFEMSAYMANILCIPLVKVELILDLQKKERSIEMGPMICCAD